ncbi:MAG: ATP-binding protein [Clostridiales bacterium]|jgi:two-component system phosphate regulon sensor histidine kinase PhoR|nr:cell wall metabolism sensor histidine kinase WalK [Eubacteriales bacterium]MDH7565452.1 ATP-binding protein [Clostridiales bacterium]
MRRKIFLHYILLVIIGISITGYFTSQLAQKFYKQEVNEKLENTARMIQHQIAEDLSQGKKVDFNDAASKYAKVLNQSSSAGTAAGKEYSRVTFIDFDGKVLGESETSYQSMENHLTRKEIQEALQGKVGKDIRTSKTLNVQYLYVALPMESARVIIRVAMPLMQLQKIGQEIWNYTVIGILAGFMLTVLLALKFSSDITKPINELIHVSREISLGNYSKRVNVKSKDELGQLADSFNNMASRLEKIVSEMTDKNIKFDSIINSMTSGIIAVDNSYKTLLINSIAAEIFGIKHGPGTVGINILELVRNHQINRFLKETVEGNASLLKEITVSSPKNRVLRIYTSPIKSNSASNLNSGGIAVIQDITNIRKLEQIRTEFVSNVTHELKTPLTSIRGFIETLRSGAIHDREVSEKFLEIIDIEAERLYMLINDILQLSEIESKQKDSNIGTYNLKSIIAETISILEGVAEKKGVRLIDESDGSIEINANRDRIKQMFINLIDNGIKYNTENGSVTIKAFKGEGKVSISVKDTGIGIAPEHLPRIFERFYRVDKGRSRSMGGTGLGLSIVKHIVNLYNGDIKVSSELGKGTEFIIQLPA